MSPNFDHLMNPQHSGSYQLTTFNSRASSHIFSPESNDLSTAHFSPELHTQKRIRVDSEPSAYSPSNVSSSPTHSNYSYSSSYSRPAAPTQAALPQRGVPVAVIAELSKQYGFDEANQKLLYSFHRVSFR